MCKTVAFFALPSLGPFYFCWFILYNLNMTVFVYLIIFYFLYLRKINEKVPTGVEVNSWTVFHIFWEKENRFSPGRVVLGISTIPRLASCLRVADKHTIHSTVLFCVCFYLITVWWVFFFFAGEDIVLFCFLNFRISGGRDCYHIGVFLVVFLFFFLRKNFKLNG